MNLSLCTIDQHTQLANLGCSLQCTISNNVKRQTKVSVKSKHPKGYAVLAGNTVVPQVLLIHSFIHSFILKVVLGEVGSLYPSSSSNCILHLAVLFSY